MDIKRGPLFFCTINIGVEDKDPRRFVLASPMCFHHNIVCNGITLLWSPRGSPMCFLHILFAMVLLFAPFFVSMLSLNTRQLR
jgi:hypothetical protein